MMCDSDCLLCFFLWPLYVLSMLILMLLKIG
uniref:Uncharacterized protein n=1 Tax=Arundo donax TaxID=35708 RepID=A0A0A8ZSU2_ARUDO